jgi:hypothetical protein
MKMVLFSSALLLLLLATLPGGRGARYAGKESDAAAAVLLRVRGPALPALHPGPYASSSSSSSSGAETGAETGEESGSTLVYTTFSSPEERIRASLHLTDDSAQHFGCAPPSAALVARASASASASAVGGGAAGAWALVVRRGNCTFERKVRVAQAAGAAAIVVLDGKRALYANATSKTLADACAVYAHRDASAGGALACDAGYDDCADDARVEFRLGEADAATARCCVDVARSVGKLRHLGAFGASGNLTIPFLFASIADAAALETALRAATDGDPLVVDMFPRGGGVDGSVFFTLCTGVLAAYVSAWFSAQKERRWAVRRFWLPLGADFMRGEKNRTKLRREAERDAEEEAMQQQITWKHAVAMLLCSATMLIGLYFLIKAGFEALILAMQIMFVYAATVALFRLVFFPLVDEYTPLGGAFRFRAGGAGGAAASATADGPTGPTGPSVPCWCGARYPGLCPRSLPQSGLAAFALSLGVALTWYFTRHWYWNFLLMNCIGMTICAMVTSTLRIKSGRVAALLLGLFFVYDVFMVFITPSIFGDSIMLEVATNGGKNAASTTVQNSSAPVGPPGAGSGSGSGSATPATLPDTECSRVPGENMPMLFMYPRLSGWPSGNSMLGFGDIIFPGILLSYALRFDYVTRGRACCPGLLRRCERPRPETREQPKATGVPYFGWLMFGYGAGLSLAFVANVLGITINGVRGQPALLYLVPCTLGPLLALGRIQGDFKALWNGFKDEFATAAAAEVFADLAERMEDGGGGGGGRGGDFGELAMSSMKEGIGVKNGDASGKKGEAAGISDGVGGREREEEDEEDTDQTIRSSLISNMNMNSAASYDVEEDLDEDGVL